MPQADGPKRGSAKRSANHGRAKQVREDRAAAQAPAPARRVSKQMGLDAPVTRSRRPDRPVTFLDQIDHSPKKRGVQAPGGKTVKKTKTLDTAVTELQQRAIDRLARNRGARRLDSQEDDADALRSLNVLDGVGDVERRVARVQARDDAKRAADRKAAESARLKKVFGKDYDIDHADVETGGASGDLKKIFTGNAAGKIVKNVATVIYEDPAKQIPKVASDTAKSLVSIPAGIIRSGLHPVDAAKAIGHDYARRYGPLVAGDEKAFHDRLTKEGVAPELFDIASTAAAGGATTGRALQAAASTGRLGSTARKVATVARPAIREGGAVKAQPLSKNLYKNAAAKAVDKGRAKVQTRRAAGDTKPEIRLAEQQGQVTHIRKGASKRAQRRDIAKRKSLALAAQKAEQQAEAKASRDTTKGFSKREKNASKYAIQLGIHTPEVARRELPVIITRIKATRRAGRDVHARNDELPVLEDLLAHPDEAFTPRVAEGAATQVATARRLAEGDPDMTTERAAHRARSAQAEHLGIARPGDGSLHVAERTAAKAEARGLAEPGYFPSEKRPAGVFSAFAVGGKKAVQGSKAYKGTLTRAGRENLDPEALTVALMKNIKRKHNWNLVAEHFRKQALPDVKDLETGAALSLQNQKFGTLIDNLERAGIDPNTGGFANPGKMAAAGARKADLDAPDGRAVDDALGSADVNDALEGATTTYKKYLTNPDDFENTTGWSFYSKAAYDEINADTSPSGAVGRSYDISKGKISRVLLANPAWLQFQIGANALLTGLAGTGPVDLAKAQRWWWHELTREERAAIGPYIGVHKWYDEQVHLGASANNKIVNSYRAFKTTALYRGAHKLNPLDAIFRADNAQNNVWRRGVFYSQLKRHAYKDMGANASAMMKAQDRLTGMMTLGPTERMAELAKNIDVIEKHAKHTQDFLGDYMTYTAAERRKLGRAVMFYGFMRFSVKFAFYTMPIEHPIMSAILLQVGRMEKDELQRIFGTDVPPWETGNYYSKDGKSRVATTRLNPFFNALQIQSPGSLFSVASPAIQIAANQVAGKDIAFDEPYTVDGKPSYVVRGRELSLANRAQIALGEVLDLSPALRVLKTTGIPGLVEPQRGKQTSDSSLIFPNAAKYQATPAGGRNAKRIQLDKEEASRIALADLAPFIGLPGEARIQRAKDYAAGGGKTKKKPAGFYSAPGGPSMHSTGTTGSMYP